MVVKLQDRFQLISEKLHADFKLAGLGEHNPTKGQNREHKLNQFLQERLPFRYGIASGEVAFRSGELSRQTDTIIYDRINCAALYSESSSILPIDGVYGIIEAKSYLTKPELKDAAEKVALFKKNAPRELSVVAKTEHVTLARPGRPFGIAFGYSLQGNSLDSLAENWMEINKDVGVVNNWLNMIVVLGEGLIILGRGRDPKAITPVLDTDALVDFTLAAMEGKNDGQILPLPLAYKKDTLLYFYFYLNALLARTRVLPVDIGRYVDPQLPPIVHSAL